MKAQINLAQLVSVAVTAAIETYIRGVRQADLDELELNQYPNQSKKGETNQAVIENVSYNPKKAREAKVRKPKFVRLSARKYQSIFGLKDGQSCFYPLPEGRTIEKFHIRVQKSTYSAKRHTPTAQFKVQRTLENGVLGIRVYRVK